MVFHFPATADHKPRFGVQDAVAGTARQVGFLQNVDAAALHLPVPDQESGGSQAGQTSAYQPRLFGFHALGLAGADKGFIISIGVVHFVPPVCRQRCCRIGLRLRGSGGRRGVGLVPRRAAVPVGLRRGCLPDRVYSISICGGAAEWMR